MKQQFLFPILILFFSTGMGMQADGQIHSETKLTGQLLIDSLRKEIPALKNDSNKIRVLNALAFEYRNVKPYQGIKYAQDALELAEQLDWKAEVPQSNNC